MASYLKTDIAKKIDEPPRKIQAWTDFGLILPEIIPPRGKGIARVYSEKNLLEFGIIKILKDQEGFSLDFIKWILNGLRAGVSQENDLYGKKAAVFEDFYSNVVWGNEKELLFLRWGPAGPGIFRTIEKNQTGDYETNCISAGLRTGNNYNKKIQLENPQVLL